MVEKVEVMSGQVGQGIRTTGSTCVSLAEVITSTSICYVVIVEVREERQVTGNVGRIWTPATHVMIGGDDEPLGCC
jgi:hypothetical protein